EGQAPGSFPPYCLHSSNHLKVCESNFIWRCRVFASNLVGCHIDLTYKEEKSMNSKKLAVLSALSLTLVLGLMVFGGRRAQAANTWYVSPTGTPSGTSGGSCASPSFNTITFAVAAASNGDTIQVCAGTYNENVIIPKTLTLNGARAGT